MSSTKMMKRLGLLLIRKRALGEARDGFSQNIGIIENERVTRRLAAALAGNCERSPADTFHEAPVERARLNA
jgi:hypothetical protein